MAVVSVNGELISKNGSLIEYLAFPIQFCTPLFIPSPFVALDVLIFFSLIRHPFNWCPLIFALGFFRFPLFFASCKQTHKSHFQSWGLKRLWWVSWCRWRSSLHSFHATLINWFSLHVLSIRLINYTSNWTRARYELWKLALRGTQLIFPFTSHSLRWSIKQCSGRVRINENSNAIKFNLIKISNEWTEKMLEL